MSNYVAIIEKSRTGFSAYVPDLPGCFAAASSLAEIKTLIRSTVVFHVECLREEGQPIPEPSIAAVVEVTA
ncbi:MAG TPA: type II toxin-antitoxin system HicB family antitoxin [Candidatus Baltobacteraceae bacterium]|nr:type II toxin-antitoxin system HicB family antitoxin [Candidatus Baltobacteraceae bacterium]